MHRKNSSRNQFAAPVSRVGRKVEFRLQMHWNSAPERAWRSSFFGRVQHVRIHAKSVETPVHLAVQLLDVGG